jgi:hypothetical protein
MMFSYMSLLDRLDDEERDVTDFDAMAKNIPRHKRLACVEQLIATGHLSREDALAFFEKFPVIPQESFRIVQEANDALQQYGIDAKPGHFAIGEYHSSFSGYQQVFIDHYGKPHRGRRVKVLAKSSLEAPLAAAWAIARRDAHSDRWFKRYEAYRNRCEGNFKRYESYWNKKIMLVRTGWPLFIAQIYAKDRDAMLKSSIYVPHLAELSSEDPGVVGARLYTRIYERSGLSGLKNARETIVTDKDLRKIAT